MSVAELHKLSSVEKPKIIEALWGDLVSDEDNLPSPSWHETGLIETEKKFLSATLKYWIGNKPGKNCTLDLNESSDSPVSYRRPYRRPKVL
jgi:hypothetical protein